MKCGTAVRIVWQEWTVNDMRLGDLDEALRMIKDSRKDNPYVSNVTAGTWRLAHDCAVSCVEAVPTIDAVPVVRCPLCKYHMVYKEKDGNGSYLGCTRPWGLRGALAPDDFCSYGERKDGDG